MRWELTNPSDYYEVESPDFLPAAVAALIVGAGSYGLTPLDGGDELPIFLFGGGDEWMQERLGTPHLMEWVGDHWVPVVAALRTIKIDDARRSSFNNIGERAAIWADRIESRYAPKDGGGE